MLKEKMVNLFYNFLEQLDRTTKNNITIITKIQADGTINIDAPNNIMDDINKIIDILPFIPSGTYRKGKITFIIIK